MPTDHLQAIMAAYDRHTAAPDDKTAADALYAALGDAFDDPDRVDTDSMLAIRERLEFAMALTAFRQAASSLAAVWARDCYHGGEVENYPEWMPSFDEAALAISAMRMATPTLADHPAVGRAF